MIGPFMNLNGRPADYFYPAIGDTDVEGTVVRVTYGITGSGAVRADGVQGVAGSGWQGAPTSGPLSTNPIPYGDPLIVGYSGQGTFCVGQRVSFDVIAAPYGVQAVNVQAI
jgi:hypothetical protein